VPPTAAAAGAAPSSAGEPMSPRWEMAGLAAQQMVPALQAVLYEQFIRQTDTTTSEAEAGATDDASASGATSRGVRRGREHEPDPADGHTDARTEASWDHITEQVMASMAAYARRQSGQARSRRDDASSSSRGLDCPTQ
jgi:hypothetical protein